MYKTAKNHWTEKKSSITASGHLILLKYQTLTIDLYFSNIISLALVVEEAIFHY